MSSIVITALYASLLALLYVVLTVRIIKLRMKHRIGINSGDNDELAAAVRVHGNFSEYVPLTLILLGAAELSGANAIFLHALGALFFIGRISHAKGLTQSIGVSSFRKYGMLSTFFCLIVLSGYNIFAFLIA